MTAPGVDQSASARAALLRSRNAVAAVFALNGLAYAGLLARVPAIRDELGLTASQLGFVLLAGSAGAVLALPSAGAVVARLGPARTVRFGAIAACSGIVVAGFGGGLVGNVALVAIGLFALGAGSGTWDVAMNVEGADVERSLGWTIMPRFHAAWSLGSVAGAGAGALAARLAVPLEFHLTVIAIAVLASVLVAVPCFTPVAPRSDRRKNAKRHSALAAWRERRTLLIGVMVLSAALVEGAANDWLALALVDGYGTSHSLAAVGFGVFVTAMMLARLVGTWLLDRFGRVVVLRTCIAFAITGVAAFVLGDSLPVALLGATLWGLGASLGFPVGMSAAADDERFAAKRVSVVASIGYVAFLAGPPLIGLLADSFGIRLALSVLLATMVLSLVVTGAARPLRPTAATRD
jgi:MFS family permease